MKKFIFFVLLISCSSFVNGQSSHSIGLSTSYFSHLNSYISRVNNKTQWRTYQSPRLKPELMYNYFIDEKHGIVAKLGIDKQEREAWLEPSVIPMTDIRKDYNAGFSMHYIFMYQHFFIESGFDLQFFDVMKTSKQTITQDVQGQATTTVTKKTFINKEQIQTVPEFHFALGRDFDLGKFNIRVNGFVEKAFLNDNYIDIGLSTGVFYQFSQ